MDKKLSVIREYATGVCIWKDAEGYVLADADNNFLSIEGNCDDKTIEAKLEQAARYWMGSEFSGGPTWVPGARKISDTEYDDQNDRLLMGKVPDPVESAVIALKKAVHGSI